VKASRLFAGHEHDQESKRIAGHFGMSPDFYQSLNFDRAIIGRLQQQSLPAPAGMEQGLRQSGFGQRDLHGFENAGVAYHQLLLDLVAAQVQSADLVLRGTPVRQLFVDGGFSHNAGYMQLLAAAFLQYEVYSANLAQASALGAALAIHEHWNSRPIPDQLISTNRIEGVKF
jgi:sugar (pentulose or hexulose) kinase